LRSNADDSLGHDGVPGYGFAYQVRVSYFSTDDLPIYRVIELAVLQGKGFLDYNH
jgi:hypothetical protein